MPDTPRHAAPPAPPTDAAVGYRPLSGLAIVALVVSILTALIVIVFLIASQVKSRPVLEGWLIILACLGLGLSLLARRQIRRSEGTRAGLALTTAALWLSLLFGFGYAAYFFATDLAIRKQAQAASEKWLNDLASGQPELAFRMTLDPSRQSALPDAEAVRRRFGLSDLPDFLHSDVARICRTWPDNAHFTAEGVKDWKSTLSGYEVESNYVLHTPEGEFKAGVTARGIDDPNTGDRNWQIIYGKTGLRRGERQFTRLGQLCEELQYHCQVRFLPTWAARMAQTPDETYTLLRVAGNVPPAAQRDSLLKELQGPRAIGIVAGGPMSPVGLPQLRVSADAVPVVAYAEANLATLSAKAVPCYITVQVTDDQLVKDILALQGPGWEKQPMQAQWDLQLKDYAINMKVIELNVLPNAPREGVNIRTQTATGGPGG